MALYYKANLINSTSNMIEDIKKLKHLGRDSQLTYVLSKLETDRLNENQRRYQVLSISQSGIISEQT